MEVQTLQGYFENGTFYQNGHEVSLPERKFVIVNILHTPISIEEHEPLSDEARLKWLDELEEARELAKDEDLPDWAFQRSKEMRPPLDLAE